MSIVKIVNVVKDPKQRFEFMERHSQLHKKHIPHCICENLENCPSPIFCPIEKEAEK